MFKLVFDKKVKKTFDKLDFESKARIQRKLVDLKNNPELGKHLLYLDLWSLRVGKFRLIYKIKKKELIILILNLEHRKSVYKK